MALQVASSAINTLRASHYTVNPATGLSERSVLLEGASTNVCGFSESISSWVSPGGTPTVVAGAIPVGVMGVSLDLVGDDDPAVTEYVNRNVTFTTDGTKGVSVFVKKGITPAPSGSQFIVRDGTAVANRLVAVVTWDAAGVPSVSASIGTYLGAVPVSNGVYRLLFTATGVVAANANLFRIVPALTAADIGDIYVGGVQVEDVAFNTSYIATPTAASVTRTADSLTLPFTTPPQEMTVYAKFIERGTLQVVSAFLLAVGNVPARFQIVNSAGKYGLTHNNGGSSVSVVAVASPVVGDLVELRAILLPTGAVQLGQSINGAAEVVTAASSANALPTAWTASILSIGSLNGVNQGFAEFLAVKAALGTQTLAAMRVL